MRHVRSRRRESRFDFDADIQSRVDELWDVLEKWIEEYQSYHAKKDRMKVRKAMLKELKSTL